MPMIYTPLILFTIACCVAEQASAQSVQVSRYRAVAPVRLSEVKWTDDFWKQRLDTCRNKTVPAMWEIMRGTKYKPYLEHFRIAAGLSEGTYHGAPFNDGDFYRWMEAVCALQATEPDPAWDHRLDEIVEVNGPSDATTSCPIRPLTTRRVRISATCSGTGECFLPVAMQSTST